VSTEHEYNTHADILDDENPSDYDVGPGPYPQTFNQQQQQQQQQPPPPTSQHLLMGVQGQPTIQQMQPMHPPPTLQAMDPNNAVYTGMNTGFNTCEPMLDPDPFGLTASMYFPTQFTFQESSMQR